MKRLLFCLSICLLTPSFLMAQGIKWNQSYDDYFARYGEVAVQQMRQYRIPASITLAQGVLESGAGKSALAVRANNHFGIKCNNDWSGRRSYHDDDERGECFRAYDNAYQSYVDHSLFLTNSPRYRKLFELKRTDYKGWARGLKSCGYATNPSYAKRLIEIIELYRLYEYDDAKGSGRVQLGELRHVQSFNKNYFVIARHGDTFRTIADDMDMSYRKLAKYNERDKKDVLKEGEIIWLQKKRRHVPKEYRGTIHRVQAGESMYSISQRYGIRLKNLYKMNDLTPDYIIQVGDRLLLR